MKSSTRANLPKALASGMPDIGKFLRQYIKAHRIHQNALARTMNIRNNTLWKYWKRPSLQVAVLWQLSLALKYNFIADMADMLPAELPRANPPAKAEKEKIAELERQIENLTRERDLLKELITKRV